MRSWQSGLSLLLVICLHGGALTAAVLWPQTPPVITEPPVISGVIIQAPPAEVVAAPSVQVAPPEPTPEPPKPKPQPKPEPKPKPKPKPVPPPPVVPPPPSETAITTPTPEPPPPEKAAPPPAAPSTPDAPKDDTLGAPVEPPRIDAKRRDNPNPAYPPLSRRRGEEGIVMLELLITAEGKVAELKVHQSSGFPRLDQSALDAVERWRFEPARRNGVPIEYRYLQPVRFALNTQ